MYNILEFNCLLGLTMASVTRTDNEIHFHTDSGRTLKLLHLQNCCESVYIEDITGDLRDLVGTPILKAEISASDDLPPGVDPECIESSTWTFFKLGTIKGYVDIRFFGSSNGYYSESAYLIEDEE